MRDMLGRVNVLDVREAQKLLSRSLKPSEPLSVRNALEESLHRILAADLYAPEDIPAFARSTVDGYAVASEDTFGASEALPAYLNVGHEITMGAEAAFAHAKGSADKIPTGGMLPQGTDAVVMFEYVQLSGQELIEVMKPVAPLENVISRGEDIREGELLLKKGKRLRPQDIAALAGAGITGVPVYEKPRVSIISTGDEVVSSDQPLKPGQVRDMNSYSLAGLVSEDGGLPVTQGIVRDDFESVTTVVESSLVNSSIIIITGGSSVGTMDLTARVINSLGSPGVIFHGVALKPGKPAMCGIVNNIPIFGLPGHPAAVFVCYEVFVRPLLRKKTGLSEHELSGGRAITRARLAGNISSGSGREEHVRVCLEKRDDEWWAIPVLGKSGLIRTLVRADGTVIVPAHVRGIEAGDYVDVIISR